MEHLASLAGIALALLLVALSPGPAFIVVSQQAMARSRNAGLVTALGVSVGSVIWVLLVILGIAVLMTKAAWLYGLLRLIGGAYLIYLGIQLWRGAREPLAESPGHDAAGSTLWGTFWRAILIQMLNPKAAVFFGSVFLTLLAPGAPAWLKGVALGLVFAIEFGWYLVVATTFSSKSARRIYGHAKAWVERVAGAWLALFGVRLALSDR
jgi:RhtB (resistance to homoserine/threonine) family protein